MLADQFTEIFRQEHRQVRDALLDLDVLDARERSNRAGLDLMQWTQQVRKRAAQAVV